MLGKSIAFLEITLDEKFVRWMGVKVPGTSSTYLIVGIELKAVDTS
jgi:hypothetical protein